MGSSRGNIMIPDWLPDVLNLNGDWDNVIKILYLTFEQDIKSNLLFNGVPIWYDRNKKSSIYEEGFWHLITKTDYTSNERVPDYERAKRLNWCKPIVENYTDNNVLYWENEEGKGKIRTYIWLEQLDYIIILEKKNMKKGSVMFLITAYYIEGNSSRSKLRKKYNKRLK